MEQRNSYPRKGGKLVQVEQADAMLRSIRLLVFSAAVHQVLLTELTRAERFRWLWTGRVPTNLPERAQALMAAGRIPPPVRPTPEAR